MVYLWDVNETSHSNILITFIYMFVIIGTGSLSLQYDCFYALLD